MKIVSAAEMRDIDRATSERFGVPSLTLMENAGSAVARFILTDYSHAQRIAIICGKGNNGGDGFVVARKLAESGRAVRVLLLCAPEELRGDAAAMFQQLAVRPLVVSEPARLDSADASEMFAADLLVDAVLGTGFRPPVSPLYAAVIRKMNASAAPMVAVDIPSGADADALQPQTGTVARADAVITFTAPRPAHVFSGLTSGATVIAPIGSPPEAIVSSLGLHLSAPVDFAPLLAPRARDANKGSYGHVLVIGGSLGKAGAAAMAGFSALRTGAGLSTVAAPRSALPTVAGFHPEVMTEPLPETEQGTISLRAFETSLDVFRERKTVIAIGPGISRNPETAEFVRAMLKPGIVDSAVPFVLDADGLNAFEGTASRFLNGHGRTLVITPHPGEMARLTGLSIAEIQADRLAIARTVARKEELIVVLKGQRTLTASPDGTVWVNPTGNPGMATGGTGDVLTGMVAGLIAQHPQHALAATALGVYLHGLSGDLAAGAIGESSLVATDIVRFLPQAFSEMRAQKSPDLRVHA
ncbi:MAG: NAD(P)H-hydrate dehydratase [Acidobacteriia bacterium]|nr:NAD(P)H-hydrate dehydratase [Terriglobia bacterium]